MNSDKALELARKKFPRNENLRVAYMLGLNEGYELGEADMKEKMMEKCPEELREYIWFINYFGEFDSFPKNNLPPSKLCDKIDPKAVGWPAEEKEA